jgi:micrococcal nuclease
MAATAGTRRLLPEGRAVRYTLGEKEQDEFGRWLAYLWLPDGLFVNEEIVERGDATPLASPPNDRWADRFRKSAFRARVGKRGLWSACPLS